MLLIIDNGLVETDQMAELFWLAPFLQVKVIPVFELALAHDVNKC